MSLQLYEDGSWVICNFDDDVAPVELNRIPYQVADRGWLDAWK